MTPQETSDCNQDAMASLAAPFCSAIDASKLTAHDWLAVEMASRGCVSGTLGEWPLLMAAFNKAGLETWTQAPALVMRNQARLLMAISPNKTTSTSIT